MYACDDTLMHCSAFFNLGIFNRTTLVSELVERGEKMLRDGLQLSNSNASKLNDLICSQLCDAGLEALTRATRYNGLFLYYK